MLKYMTNTSNVSQTFSKDTTVSSRQSKVHKLKEHWLEGEEKNLKLILAERQDNSCCRKKRCKKISSIDLQP